MTPLLQATDIAHAFGDHPVLDGVDVSVNPGEALGVIGPNGAGKTTLLKIAAGVLAPDRGRLYLHDRPLSQLTRRQIARHIAVVPQATPQVFDYSVLEFVLMGHYTRTTGFVPADDEIESGRRALVRMQLADYARRPVSHLSGGQMQRALVARALVTDAGLWLLDEPTASLDVRHRATVLDRVRDHVDDGNAAVAVLHQLELVHRYFDRVLALFGGEIIADGPPDRVLTEPLVSRMYEVPMRRGRVGDQVVWVAE